jgi:hypothetical protein
MSQSAELTKKHRNLLFCLQGIILLALSSYWLGPGPGFTWFPNWLGAAVSFSCLLGMLIVFWRARALRGWLIAAFIGVLLAAPAVVWLLGRP